MGAALVADTQLVTENQKCDTDQAKRILYELFRWASDADVKGTYITADWLNTNLLTWKMSWTNHVESTSLSGASRALSLFGALDTQYHGDEEVALETIKRNENE